MVEKSLSRSVRIIFSGSLVFGIGFVAPSASAQEAAMQRIEITGSSIKRVDSETALPVQLITKADIARTGATSTEELLNSISALSSSGGTANATGAGTSTGGLSSISLRGLGDARTLVLVNGRRIAAFAGGGGAAVNVNVIPLAAIERIEVLKDGASGVYGSDAVAGVVNFILSRNFEGLEVTGGYGSPTESGGGQNQKVALTGGIGKLDTDGFSLVLSGSLEKSKVLFGRDRDYASTSTKLPFYSGGATGLGNIQGAWIPGTGSAAGFSTGGSGYGNPLAASNTCESIRMKLSPTLSAKGQPYCYFDSAPNVGLLPDRELSNLTANFTYKLNDNAQLFADGLYSKSKVTQTYQPSPARASFFETDSQFAAQKVDGALLLYPSNPNYQTIALPYLTSKGLTSLIGQPLSITSRVFDFGPRQNVDDATQSRLVVGAKGSVANQDYEVAYSTNQSKLTSSVTSGYFSQVAYAKIINDQNNNWNPWATDGIQTGALATKLKTSQFSGDFFNATSKSNTLDGKISGDLFKLNDLMWQYAAGAQLRRERYITDPSAAYESGDISGLGGQQVPIDRSRNVNSFFGEASIPVLKTLDGGLAVRTDRYNDVGSSTNYKANLRWQPIKTLLLRGSLGTGFRAPSLSDLWTPQTSGTSEQFTDPTTHQTQLQVTALSGGNPNLKPEKSDQASIGLVFSPLNNFTVGVDVFKLKIKDILATPSAQEIVSRFRAGDPAYAGLVTLNGNDVASIKTILANTGEANVSGADVFANWRETFGFGRLDVNLNGTYMSKFDQASPGGVISHKVGTIVDGDGTPVIGASTGGVVLRWKHALSGTWTTGAWATTLIQNFSSRYEVGHDLNDERVFIPSQSIFDVNVTYKMLKDLTLAVGVKNLANKQPSTFVPVSNQFQAGYDVNQYDPRGRFAYVNATYRFK